MKACKNCLFFEENEYNIVLSKCKAPDNFYNRYNKKGLAHFQRKHRWLSWFFKTCGKGAKWFKHV